MLRTAFNYSDKEDFTEFRAPNITGRFEVDETFFVNQIAMKRGNYHFDTTGTIYGFGYGPKSNCNEFGLSVCKFANSKFSELQLNSILIFLLTFSLKLCSF